MADEFVGKHIWQLPPVTLTDATSIPAANPSDAAGRFETKAGVVPNSVPRRGSGAATLKAADAVSDDDLVTMKQLKLVKTLALAGVVLP